MTGRPFLAFALQAPLAALRPGPRRRRWMDEFGGGFANRCLPLLIANQSGWEVQSPGRVRATWNGGPSTEDLQIEVDDDVEPPQSHFGGGLLTWRIPYLFRTPPGWNTLVRGPVNRPKDGAASLEGVVETDWAVAPAFHTWQLTRPGLTVEWEEGEPFCAVIPQRRGEVEEWIPEVRDIYNERKLCDEYAIFSDSRRAFNADRPGAWQKHYFKGFSPGNAKAPHAQHQRRLRVKPFAWSLLTEPPPAPPLHPRTGRTTERDDGGRE